MPKKYTETLDRFSCLTNRKPIKFKYPLALCRCTNCDDLKKAKTKQQFVSNMHSTYIRTVMPYPSL